MLPLPSALRAIDEEETVDLAEHHIASVVGVWRDIMQQVVAR